jgi:hypothetical protein
MSDLDDLFNELPIGQIAKQLGVSEAEASTAVAAALPTLVKGLEANAKDPSGAAKLGKALKGKSTSLVEGGISLADVDTKDGEKIVSHIFGGKSDDVASKLGGLGDSGGLGSDLTKQLLAILAPIVLAWILKKVTGGGGSAETSEGGIGDILGQVLTGSSGGGSSSGGILESVLGQVLGGSSGGSSSSGGLGGLDQLLGGLLGGGSR